MENLNRPDPETGNPTIKQIDARAMLQALHEMSGNAAARANQTVTGVPGDVDIPGTYPNHDLMDK